MTARPVEYDRRYEELSIKDKENKKALVNITPSWLADAIQAIPDDVLDMTLEELEVKLRIHGAASMHYHRMRIAFWEEYHRAIRLNKKMQMSNVYGGISDVANFQRDFSNNSFKLAFILKPPVEFNVALEEICLLGMTELRNIMVLPIVNAETGEVDSKLAQVKLKIWQDAMDRRRGHVLKQIDVRSNNLHLHAHKQVQEAPMSADEVESKMKELEPPKHEKDIVRTILQEGVKEDVETEI